MSNTVGMGDVMSGLYPNLANPVIQNLASDAANSVAPEVSSGYFGAGGTLANAFKTFGGPKFLGGTGEAAGPMGVGALLPALPGYLAAQYGPGLINATGIGTQDQRDVAGNIVAGAGLGSMGFALGPEVGVPATIVGALGGAAKGVLENIFGEDQGQTAKDLKDTLTSYGTNMKVNPSDYTAQFDMMKKLGMSDPKTGKALTDQQIAQTLVAQMAQEHSDTESMQQAATQQQALHQQDLNYSLAAQSQAHDFFAPYTNQLLASSQAQHDTLMKLADQAPSEYKGVFQAQAANALNSGQQTAAAYMGQIALQPSMQIMANQDTLQAKQQAQLNQALQLAVQMRQQQGGGGAGGVNFSNLGGTAQAGSATSQVYGG